MKVWSGNDFVLLVGTNKLTTRENEKKKFHEIDRRTNDLYEKGGKKDEWAWRKVYKFLQFSSQK